LIDAQLEPLYIIENGIYSFRPDKLQAFAMFADEARLLVASIETKLTEEFKKQLK
jgi:hypothetical protein